MNTDTINAQTITLCRARGLTRESIAAVLNLGCARTLDRYCLRLERAGHILGPKCKIGRPVKTAQPPSEDESE